MLSVHLRPSQQELQIQVSLFRPVCWFRRPGVAPGLDPYTTPPPATQHVPYVLHHLHSASALPQPSKLPTSVRGKHGHWPAPLYGKVFSWMDFYHSPSVLLQITKGVETRSSWLNCASRDYEAVYWVSIGHFEAVADGN